MAPLTLRPHLIARGVTAVLGPTNTGKTHLAIERMLGHGSGIIGLPLRLLAREVYQRLVDRAGVDAVALVTGEEKIKPQNARYWVATTEAMPRDLDASFVAIDEVQLAADPDRGHVFTDALLNRRGTAETLLIGASTMKPLIEALIPGANIISRPRLSKLAYAGERKITRLPPRSAIVAFSAEEVYAIAELIRRQRGGAAVVMGALSPRTRNAQVAMFQNGDVEHLVATDAIGMGLNLDIEHVAFAASRKFDGGRHRDLAPAEMGQIAGRAGRAARDGTFGTTGRCPPFDQGMIDDLEAHRFDPIRLIHWRNPALNTATVADLLDGLAQLPDHPNVVRAKAAEDEICFDIALMMPKVRDWAALRDGVRRLWDMCQLPDYRKVAPNAHADLVVRLFEQVMTKGAIETDWFAREVAGCDRTDGDIETLSHRVAQIRTWTFCANRNDWLADPEHWQGVTRAIEDKLSDALHERLTQRFVDRRTSVLMRRLRENAMLESEINAAGDVMVEGQHVGRLDGFRFTPDSASEGQDGKALRAAAGKVLAGEIEIRAARLAAAGDDALVLGLDGSLRWLGQPIARLVAGEKVLEPRSILLADEVLAGAAREQVEARIATWLKAHVQKLLGPLAALEAGEGLTGMARGVGYRLAEDLGVIERSKIANDVKSLDQTARGELRKHGVRFGAHHIFTSGLMKPGARALAAQLFQLKRGADPGVLGDLSALAFSGRTTIPVDAAIDAELYRIAGFRVCGPRAIRVDILERLADLIRPAIAYRPGTTEGLPPAGAADGDGFVITNAMTSLVGCSGDDFAAILQSLGYRREQRPGPAITVALKLPPPKPAPAEPVGTTDAAKAAGEGGEGEAIATIVATPSEGGAPGMPAPAEAAEAEAPALPETADEGAEAAADTQAQDPAPQIEAGQVDEAPVGDTSIAPAHDGETGPEEEAAPEAAALAQSGIAAETAEPESEAAPAEEQAEVGAPATTDETAPDGEIASEAEPSLDVEGASALGSDAAPEPAADGAPADPVEPAEPAVIDIWRIARPDRPQRRPQGPRPDRGPRREGSENAPFRREFRSGDAPARDGERPNRPFGDRPPRPDRGPRPDFQPRPQGEGARAGDGDRPPRPPREARAQRWQPGDPPAGGAPGHAPGHAPGRAPGGGPGERNTAPRPDRPDRRADRPDRRPDNRPDRGNDQRRPQRFESAPRKDNDKPFDPDSPFAKLLALKQQMEGKGKGE